MADQSKKFEENEVLIEEGKTGGLSDALPPIHMEQRRVPFNDDEDEKVSEGDGDVTGRGDIQGAIEEEIKTGFDNANEGEERVDQNVFNAQQDPQSVIEANQPEASERRMLQTFSQTLNAKDQIDNETQQPAPSVTKTTCHFEGCSREAQFQCNAVLCFCMRQGCERPICQDHVGSGHIGKKGWLCCVGKEQHACKDHIGKAKCCTIITYLVPLLLVLIAVAPALAGGGGGGSAGAQPILEEPVPVPQPPPVEPVKPPPPEPPVVEPPVVEPPVVVEPPEEPPVVVKEKECFYWVEETYYEDTGEVIDRVEL